MVKINDKTISPDFIGFVFDGCHKIYLVKESDLESVEEIWGEDEPVYLMSFLPVCYKNSCSLKFISSWDLKEHFVRQFEDKVVFDIDGIISEVE